ncbi:MAG: hypothetical protein IPL41_12345 [Micropruina sp.]|nr:hypothetical protein [Micropruina sp.]
MYQPRRSGGHSAQRSRAAAPSNAVAQAPRRATRRWYVAAADRAGAIFLGLAVTATAGALTLAGTATAAPAATPVTTPDTSLREGGVSREAVRPQIAAEDVLAVEAASQSTVANAGAVLQPTRTMYAKKPLTALNTPSAGAKKVASVKVAAKVTVTPQTSGKYRLVKVNGDEAWVLKTALSNSKPTENQIVDATAQAATRKVPGGSVLGLQPEAMVVYRAVMARWNVKNVGGYRTHSRSVHQFGRAIDFMTYTNTAQGYAVRDFLVAHAKEFGVDHIIYRQHIWTPYKPVWRLMEDRGNPTDNHMDHVHVAVKDR